MSKSDARSTDRGDLLRTTATIVIVAILATAPVAFLTSYGHPAAGVLVAVIAMQSWIPVGIIAKTRHIRQQRRLAAAQTREEELEGRVAAGAALEEQLRRELLAAQTDPLTGLPNRTLAERAIAAASAVAAPLTIAFADADGLHTVNANGGHAAGDQYLKAIAVRLLHAAASVSAGAQVSRTGGDEFMILVPRADATALRDAIRVALVRPVIVAGRRMQLRVSVGIALSSGGNARYALAQADAAMFTAKRAGNQTLIYNANRDGVPELDGTRPRVRRRDVEPDRDTAARATDGTTPTTRLVCSLDEAATIANALWLAYDRWAAVLQAEPNDSAASTAPVETIDVTPTAEGLDRTAAFAEAEMAKYAGLARRISAAIDAASEHS
ncbi:diguanylate cyclase (GGDEF)-like protein [Micromonospora profundi]|uniref:GGDEF domain-containing protein n=1 Tax=Micromonospora profundi TaxID=1420889 RepID=UPI00143B39BF|nr:GGDEF domain-containing protein [Micromonospora profundi]NJC13184.1 diguanylate cyclase (GGDEF)-like protein [Micromonospora profundi]